MGTGDQWDRQLNLNKDSAQPVSMDAKEQTLVEYHTLKTSGTSEIVVKKIYISRLCLPYVR